MYAALDETRRHRAALKDYLLSPSHTLVPHAKHATVIGACFVCLRKFYIVRPKHRCPLCCEVVCSRCTWSLDVLGRDHHLHQVVVCVSCYFDKRIQDLVTEGDSDDDDDDPGAAYPNDRDDDDDTSSNDEESYSEDVYPWTPTSDRRISMDNTTNAAAGHAKVSELDPLPETPAPSRPKPQRASRLRPRRYAFVKRDELVPKRELIPKRGATQCERCHRSFKLLHRKHHCHTCGNVYCSHCTTYQFTSAAKGHALCHVRVCWTCVHISIVQSTFRSCRRKQMTVTALLHDPSFHPVQTRQYEGRDVLTSVLQLEASGIVPYDSLVSRDYRSLVNKHTTCFSCRSAFLFLLRKDYCRLCGEAHCLSCLNALLAAGKTHSDELELVKVCQACRLQHCEDVTRRFCGIEASP
ncbi:hypothetical protein SDRG_07948 [Saprolegnia diclina VS20]|uniref:FYVE-type domain-containing protein n=1 Tax=Saprolegnia diclina (strain VS20) TaxID=1156394 RepID=T0QIT6_SAPDV|nr:hypothetical protein SDRG_07948 [Saprolegnia diclina VS20]EQC34626.1 hypothetical protein SDRG_07948 [Saprolegnia diclina VS20]|eukprot:XP_008612032.1 hypothetical protein SDRG_07948 [Saprolegnia diclina VS20]